ncbi:NAD(P)H dehydrogenase (quinone) FQR1-like [Glycine soja]|uniref:NAD(P)H dehydrogenase (quinone) FQR1-like n=1 Tax=Glycine soja TaxID=3848 RepID=UPI00103B578D|nr:NAD(P)H dehydrogenase (quinone) FQR1-like [Glycine soja]
MAQNDAWVDNHREDAEPNSPPRRFPLSLFGLRRLCRTRIAKPTTERSARESGLLKYVLDRVHLGYQPGGMAQHVLFGARMFNFESTRGGSPYGAGVFAGDGTRQASDMELELAEYHGKYI